MIQKIMDSQKSIQPAQLAKGAEKDRLEAFQGDEFNKAVGAGGEGWREKNISIADLIVLGGCWPAGSEGKAAKKGRDGTQNVCLSAVWPFTHGTRAKRPLHREGQSRDGYVDSIGLPRRGRSRLGSLFFQQRFRNCIRRASPKVTTEGMAVGRRGAQTAGHRGQRRKRKRDREVNKRKEDPTLTVDYCGMTALGRGVGSAPCSIQWSGSDPRTGGQWWLTKKMPG